MLTQVVALWLAIDVGAVIALWAVRAGERRREAEEDYRRAVRRELRGYRRG